MASEKVDELDALRHQLADVEAALVEFEATDIDPDNDRLLELKAERDRVEAAIAETQNPVGAAVTGEVMDVTAAQAEEYKPAGRELVASPGEPESVFVVLDRHDEAQIIEEFQRRALKVMLYDFEIAGGTRTVDLSYQGVNEAVRLINNTGKARIRIDKDAFGGRGFEEQIVTEDVGHGPEEFYVMTVMAVNDLTGFAEFGTSTEPKYMRLRNGKTKWDIFARTKALNKAQRNALKGHIPEAMRQTLIAMHKQDEVALKQIQAGAGAAAEAELPPPVADERAEELNREIRATYDEIRGFSVLALLPGQFGHRLRRAQHSHELLEAFLGELVAQRDHLKTQQVQEQAS